MSAMVLVVVLGVGGACSSSTGDTASPGASGPSSAAASPASSATPSTNTKETCAAAKTMVSDTDVDTFTKRFGALITARQLKNADAEAAAKTGIQTTAGTWARQLGELGQRADDPALRTALGNLATALTTISTNESLAGVHTFEDAARLAGVLSDALDALTKACG
jgi:hypothetical protein